MSLDRRRVLIVSASQALVLPFCRRARTQTSLRNRRVCVRLCFRSQQDEVEGQSRPGGRHVPPSARWIADYAV